MKKMSIFLILLVLLSMHCFGERISFPVLAEYPKMVLSDTVVDGSVYVSGYRDDSLYRINYSSGGMEKLTDNSIVLRVLSKFDEQVIYEVDNEKEQNGILYSSYEFMSYNINTKVISMSDMFEWIVGVKRRTIFPHEYYQNEIFYSQDVRYWMDEGVSDYSKISIYDYGNKKTTAFPLGAALWDMSPDKMHLLLAEDKEDSVTVYNIQSGEIKRGYGYWQVENNPAYRTIGSGFLSNDIFYIPRDFFSAEGSFEVHSVSDKSIRFEYELLVASSSKGVGAYELVFSDDLTRALVNTRSGGKTYLCDTTRFRDNLLEKNLLFRPTTAVSTESRVRIRENPNLEAQTFGHLEPGDELEVTDRSGVKVKIGEMTDWWYKIKRKSDGLEGWAYGAFLKLASYQGELGPSPEKDLR